MGDNYVDSFESLDLLSGKIRSKSCSLRQKVVKLHHSIPEINHRLSKKNDEEVKE